ncbi:NAD-dependent epimerase/dehydratase family protein [Salisediminibacterium selenitireducens]|uniref:NAD-dependent epimerase/dehydratase n=1 Tax=Bacillus selenitireducens (strain ATCC 700615 / DSM 15326 / MLS10) TaxID=439292 RepID=D6XZ95_BACIE|nr:NAD-dependent epimerase/dehydratase family protein [Salisediminibacterium selenitireducens]ADI00380.1 NAD-dependent epimerase/dehydratase [[Bacillus] selenitireducens MLS10]
MEKVLVLGGTRFFGKRLTERLLKEGKEVTLATRGESGNPFGNTVHHLKVDRFNRGSMEKIFQDGEWDVIYDQICFSPDDAMDAVDIFSGRTGRYVFTSTLSVYDFDDKGCKKEDDFDPFHYPLKEGRKEAFSYGEGKRLAEAVFAQKADFPVTMVRPPIVVGTDDYTKRLQYYMQRIQNRQPIGLDQPDARLSFVHAGELADFLYFAGHETFTGPVNTSSPDAVSLHELMQLMQHELQDGSVIIQPTSDSVEASPMNFPASYYQDVNRAKEAGFAFSPMSNWLPGLIRDLKHSIS